MITAKKKSNHSRSLHINFGPIVIQQKNSNINNV
jgi:hypothetical protein